MNDEIPLYISHKTVRAGKITQMSDDGIKDNAKLVTLHLDLGETSCTVVKEYSWCLRHEPHVGGYYVLYEDGYTSFSPAEPFEKGYTKLSPLRCEYSAETIVPKRVK